MFSNIFKSIEYKVNNFECSDVSLSEKVDIQLDMYLNRLHSINDNTVLIIDDFDTIYTNFEFRKRIEKILEKIKNTNICAM